MFNYRECPNCKNITTYRRTGAHFDQERRCTKCDISYDPHEEYEKYLKQEEKRLQFNTFKE